MPHVIAVRSPFMLCCVCVAYISCIKIVYDFMILYCLCYKCVFLNLLHLLTVLNIHNENIVTNTSKTLPLIIRRRKCIELNDVVVMELVGLRYRSALGVTVQIAFAIGYMMQPAMAIFLRDDFRYQLAALTPNLVFPFLIMCVSCAAYTCS